MSKADVAVIIPNYNMPEVINNIANTIWYDRERFDLIIVDNGSDIVNPSKLTRIFLPDNVQTCKGWLAGFEVARMFEFLYGKEYFAFVFGITSARLHPDYRFDLLFQLKQFLLENGDAVGIMPSLSLDSTLDIWQHMKNRGTNAPRRVFGLDSIFTMWRADWFKAHPFDPAFYYAWGTGEEISWFARSEGKSLWVHDGLQMTKTQDVGYAMERMNMSSKMRRELAMQNVTEVMERKYGKNWSWRMNCEFVEESWK